jgi:hypothetical protein
MFLLILFPVGAAAYFGASSSNFGNGVSTAQLQASSAPVSSHPDSESGMVQMWWYPSPSSFVEVYQIQRGTSPLGPFTTVATGPGTSYTDVSAEYNQQYYYRTVAIYQNWTAPSGVSMALSLPPTAGIDVSDGIGTALSAADLSAMSVSDNSTYETKAAWPEQDYQSDSYLEVWFSPVVVPSGTVHSVLVTLHYEVRQNVSNFYSDAEYRLLVSGDGGLTWTFFDLSGTANDRRVETTVDVTGVINSASAVENLVIRFQAHGARMHPGQGHGPPGLQFTTMHDLVHVDVN